MSLESRLARVRDLLDRPDVGPLARVQNGTADRPRKVALVDLAAEHAEAWIAENLPKHGTRGGSSNPTDLEEAQEQRRVHALALIASTKLPELVQRLERDAEQLCNLVTRCTAIVDHSQLDDAPGCLSCARVGHFNPVYEKAPGKNLCRWCYDYHRAEAVLPPAEAVDIYHRQTPRAAHEWLARREAS